VIPSLVAVRTAGVEKLLRGGRVRLGGEDERGGARLDVEGDDDLVDDLGGLAVAAHPG
jgi:hypothetical protein